MRWIAHVDMDSFYVSVERLKNPKLIGKPVVVGGLGLRSVVSSASYEARKFGVRSAMPMGQARRLCRDLVVVEPSFGDYSNISSKIFARLTEIAPVVEQVSVDEAYLDFTGCEKLFASREASAQKVKQVVKEVSGLMCTVAIATNKLIAKIGSDFAKPDGLLVIEAGQEAKFLDGLSIKKIPGLGPKTSVLFEHVGIHTCGELSRFDSSRLRELFGDHALELQRSARGESFSEVTPWSERKSLSAEETFEKDVGDLKIIRDYIFEMAERLGTDMRSEGLATRTIAIKLCYADFTTLVRARTLNAPTTIAKDIAETAYSLLEKNKDPRLKLRLLGISCRGFTKIEESKKTEQYSLFEDPAQRLKREKVESLKDELKRKFGHGILRTR